MKALIIDDSTATRFILAKMLKELGFETLEAADGSAALSQLEVHPDTHVALVDWNMPVMNGIEFVAAARKDSRFSNTKLLMVTTETEMMNVVRALEAGANEYIMKPFTKEVVEQKLKILGF
jgi:two-component system chemotaxis response regulator CheY